MTGKIAYTNARVIDPASGVDHAASESGGVLTDGSSIVAMGPDIFNVGRPAVEEIVNCGGAVLAPGLVDMRVDFCEPGAEHKEDIESGSKAAAAGGVTAVVTLPDTKPAIDDSSVLEFVARRARDVKL
ncbi:MAG: dihydroorotase, partial [Alphaproteobacteria bacterium]|nr:dihydroorotase [Alphaproteobacteria bacterium]